MPAGRVYLEYRRYSGGWQTVSHDVIEESQVSIFVNGVELATLMATPLELDKLALGFLCNEGVIHGQEDVSLVHMPTGRTCVDVWLKHACMDLPRRAIRTSGCGGGVTFTSLTRNVPPLDPALPLTVAPGQLTALMKQLQPADSLYMRAGGVHAAALSDGQQILATAEDIGRHNAIDKLRGACLLAGQDCRGLLLLCTGRLSSDMLRKAARMECPLIASRTSPTSLSVELAQKWNITLAGYVRGETLNVYTHPERIHIL